MPAPVFLVGGGRDDAAAIAHFAVFLAACGSASASAATLQIACVTVENEPSGTAGAFDRFADLIIRAGRCRPFSVPLMVGDRLVPGVLDDADGLVVCGGLTPAYADALVPAAEAIWAWRAAGDRPYLGFSAGSAIAATEAVVGGWLLDGTAICPEECAEDLDELSVVPGLGLVPFAVEVHCAQWGTLGRLVAAVGSDAVPVGVGVDEDTMLSVTADEIGVSGLGQAWVVTSGDDGVEVRPVRAGGVIPLPAGRLGP